MGAKFVPLARCQVCASGCIRAEEDRDDAVGYVSQVYVCDNGHLVDEVLGPERRPQGRASVPAGDREKSRKQECA